MSVYICTPQVWTLHCSVQWLDGYTTVCEILLFLVLALSKFMMLFHEFTLHGEKNIFKQFFVYLLP